MTAHSVPQYLFPTMQPGIWSHNYHKKTILRKHLLVPAGAVTAPDCVSLLAPVEDTRLSGCCGGAPEQRGALVSCFSQSRLFWCRSTCLLGSSVRTDMGPPVRAVVHLGKSPSAWMRRWQYGPCCTMTERAYHDARILHAQQMERLPSSGNYKTNHHQISSNQRSFLLVRKGHFAHKQQKFSFFFIT